KRLEQARAQAEGAKAAIYPQVNGSASVVRQRLSENSFYPPPYGGSYQTLADASVNASWDLDFWGKNRNALKAALSETQAQQAEQQAAQLMVSTAVVRTYYQLAQALQQQTLAEQALKEREQELQLIQDRIRTGLDTNVELNQGRGTLAAAQVDLESAKANVALARHALATLSAQKPEVLQNLTPTLPAKDIQSLPADVPVDIIGRRPDLAAARARVDAATAGIASAKAEFYPNINLSAFIGLSSFGLGEFLNFGSRVLGAGPAIHLPIFDAGRLRANLKSKNADLDIAIASYNQTLLEAVQDVADQITSLDTVHKQVEKQETALEAAESAYRLANIRYKAGLSTYLNVLSAEDNVLRERSRSLDLKARRLDLNIALIKSLGGGYAALGDTPNQKAEALYEQR
ncbi:MAG TPA: efflux transporter outer membrane subunit, partial [Methylophilaceae bacterium]|nr:efflux transporter outer membrane subunit [Methylophilaceae bacterium]